MTVVRASLFLALSTVLLVACSDGPSATTATNGTTPAAATNADGAPAAVEPSPQGSLEAVALELGTILDADGRVATTAERVRASDTVQVSLVTVGEAEGAPIAVQWRDAAGTVFAEDQRAITTSGPAVHTFSRKPDAPWAPGRYEVEVTLGGESAGVRSFEVR